MTIRVLLVDDEALVRTGFRLILDAEGDIEVVGEADDGTGAVKMAVALRPDVIVMDIRMRDVDGIEATRQILAANPAARIVVLTTFDFDEHVYAALRGGVAGFLLKSMAPDRLPEAIRTAARGDAMLDPSITRRLIEAYAEVASAAPDEARLAVLTTRERDVMEQVGRGLSNREIASALFVSEATVKTHVSSILAKLALRDRAQIAVAAFETGLVRPGG